MSGRLTDQQKIEIVEKYQTGDYSYEALAELYAKSKGCISSLLKRRNIQARPIEVRTRKHHLNQKYFDIVDTEEKAYFLGLLYADGCNHTENGSISLSLKEEDILILEKFKYAVESSRPINFIKSKKAEHSSQYVLNLSSTEMSKSLVKLGVVKAKSLILKFPTEEQVPSHLIRHFIRGMWDGDGCFTYRYAPACNGKNRQYSARFAIEASLVGTKDICEQTSNIINQIRLCQCYIYDVKNSDIKRLKMSGIKSVYNFIVWLYSDCSIYLDRKYNKCKEIENILIKSQRIDNIQRLS